MNSRNLIYTAQPESPWGFGNARGSVYPASMGGPFGYPKSPLPLDDSYAADFRFPGYLGKGLVIQPYSSVKSVSPYKVTFAEIN